MADPRSILVLRPDRLGDVIVSTPLHRVLRRRFPKAQIHWLVQDWIAPLLEGIPGMTSVIRYQPQGRHAGWAGIQALTGEMRERRADWVLALQSTPRVSFAALRAGIPVRVGPLSKLHSYFLYNQGVRQNRSDSKLHEAEYGLELLGSLGVELPFVAESRAEGPEVTLSSESLEWAQAWLERQGISPKSAIGIHPGMGGSALNWPLDRYISLAHQVATTGVHVVLTAGMGEEDLQLKVLEGIRARDPQVLARIHPVSALKDQMDLTRLAALQSLLSVYIAPSTGPLHLASAVGTPVVSVYPPIQVQHPKRWGPYVDSDHAKILTPLAREECGQKFKCRGRKCEFYPCMDRVSAGAVLKQVLELQGQSRRRSDGNL